MPAKSIINQFQTQPKAVLDLVAALQALGGGQAEPQAVRRFLYPGANDARDRWNEYLETAESLGLATREPLAATVEEELDERAFGRLLRRRLREEERTLGANTLVYIAYRAALGLEPEINGGTPARAIMDSAEANAARLMGASQQRRYDQDKMDRWRRWITAAGLGFTMPPNAFVICPAVALRDELETWAGGDGELALGDFIAALNDIPLLSEDPGRGETLPVGAAAALQILEEEGALRLVYHSDARRQWRLPGRAVAVTHVEVIR
jgi:hypothetical protein